MAIFISYEGINDNVSKVLDLLISNARLGRDFQVSHPDFPVADTLFANHGLMNPARLPDQPYLGPTGIDTLNGLSYETMDNLDNVSDAWMLPEDP